MDEIVLCATYYAKQYMQSIILENPQPFYEVGKHYNPHFTSEQPEGQKDSVTCSR